MTSNGQTKQDMLSGGSPPIKEADESKAAAVFQSNYAIQEVDAGDDVAESIAKPSNAKAKRIVDKIKLNMKTRTAKTLRLKANMTSEPPSP